MNLRIRVLDKESDLKSIQNIRKEAICNAPESFAESKKEVFNKTDDDYRNMLSDHDSDDFVIGAFKDTSIIGVVGFFHEQKENLSHKGWIWGLYVKPEFRCSGIATKILKHALEKTYKIGRADFVKLTVVTNNSSAISLYKKLGFSIFGTEPCALNLNGCFYDEHHMQLKIKD